MRVHRLAILLLAALPLVAPGTARAGGPLANCDDGVPFLWPNGGQDIVWNADLGGLGLLDKMAADEFVDASFDAWTNIDSATISFVQGADLPVDVDETNFLPFFDAAAPDGLSAIVYDNDGAIFDLLFGPGSGVLGFAGPEWGDTLNCTITEGLAFLNGPEFSPDDPNTALSIMVHEFGHFSNLAHSQTNGGILLGIAVGEPQASGPDPHDTFGAPTVADFVNEGLIETMYPFFFGPQFGTESPGRDDITAISRLYPAAGHFDATAAISGSIFSPNGATRISGVNVIARNVDDPFLDAVSALSGDFTDEVDPELSAVVGTYQFTGLTPGAQYAVFVDEILDGGFSTPPRDLPGPEEFASGAGESNSDAVDTFAAISAGAGETAANVDVIFNVPQPGDPLGVGDDGFVELFPPFPIDICGQRFTSLFVNANGNVTFGGGDGSFSESTLAHLSGAPRIAGLWDDLNPAAGGVVTFDQTSTSFTVKWEGVPEFPAAGANTFSVTINKKDRFTALFGPAVGNPFSIRYGAVSALDALSGYSCGGGETSGFETESDLSALRSPIGGLIPVPAVFEDFVGGADPAEVVDLANRTLRFKGAHRIIDLTELFRRNDSIAKATPLPFLPFDSANPAIATVIEPIGADVDYYSVRLKAGEIIAIEVVRAGFDTVIGVFDAESGELLAADDDGGNGLLSRLLLQTDEDIKIAIAVSAFPDLDFTGAGEEGGRYTLYVNTYRGEPIAIGDDDTLEVDLGGFAFDFQGEDRTSLFVNSNGSISFEAGDTDFSGTPAELLAGPPRIAPLWQDLDPTGFLGNPGLVIVDTGARSAKVHFVSVSAFFSSSPNYFSAELGRRGDFDIKYGPTARAGALVGVTEGNGAADPGPTDLSRGVQDAEGTSYEVFATGVTTKGVSNFDLSFDRIFFR
jgi:hypothetical protein